MKPSAFLKYSILLVPFIFFCVGSNIELAKFGNDPNYVYLINAAGLCTGHGVGYIDHPGTTVMQISAATIAAKHSISNPGHETLLQHVFKDPHTFIIAIRNVFLVMNSLILFALGWVAYKKTKLIWATLLLQASTLITTISLDHVWTKISPAPILFFITCIFVITILYFYADPNKTRWKYVIVFSLIIGAGIVTKATFIPLAVLPFIVLPTLKRKLLYGLGILPSFVLFSIPIIPEYENMYYWFKGLGSHSGIYGHGEKGFIDWATYFPNIWEILINNPIFATVFIIGVIFVIISFSKYVRFKRPFNDNERILTGLIGASGAGILLVAKHYHSNHYLIPELLLSGISIFFILSSFQNIRLQSLIKKYIGPSLVLLLALFLVWKQPPKIRYINDGYKMTNVEMDSVFPMIERNYPDYTKIYYYPISLNLFSALNFGNVYSKQEMLPDLKKLYGDVYFLNTVSGNFHNWTTEIPQDDIVEKNGNKILVVSGPRDDDEVKKLAEKGFPLIKIYKGRLQAVYQLDTIKYAYLKSLREKNISEIISCDMEIVSNDNTMLLGSNGEAFGNAIHRSNEISHSGEYSVKMDESTEFSLEYQIKNMTLGDEYSVEVWRKSNEKSGLLVISSNDAKQFYKTQGNGVKTDENGWDLLRIKFTVTPEIRHETIKIYLWNINRKSSYFDDLIITISKPDNQ